MTKKENKKEETVFDYKEALKECPQPEWVKKAFTRTMPVSEIKNKTDLKKMFKKYGGMK